MNSLIFDMLLEYLANRMVDIQKPGCSTTHSVHEKVVPEPGPNEIWKFLYKRLKGLGRCSADKAHPHETHQQATLLSDDLPPMFQPESRG